MPNSRARLALPVLALVAGSVATAAPPAVAGNAAVPASHVKECKGDGLAGAGAMALVSSASGKDASGGYTSSARAWVYAGADEDEVCVITKVVGAKVRHRSGQSTDYSVGQIESSDGHVVLDTGEVLPVPDSMSGSNGSSERTDLSAHVVDVVETERITADDVTYLPPGLAGLAGHEGTLTVTSVSIAVSSQAWTSRKLARPLTKAQRTKKRAAEVRVAQARFAERVEDATARREEQLELAATQTGLAAAWTTFLAQMRFEMDRMSARASLQGDRQLAREHAAEAARGTDTREAYAHEINLTVPLG